jgi:hypothetical protein
MRDPADELPRVTPAMLRQADTMCPRRLNHEHESGRKLSPLGGAQFEVASRLTNDAITWHKGATETEEGFPEPSDLEPEQRAVYRAAARAYSARFGDDDIEIHDELGWTTEFEDIGVRLVCSLGIPVEHADGRRELRQLRLAGRDLLVDDTEVRCLLLRAADWAPDGFSISAVDLLENTSIEYEIDVRDHIDETREWLAARVAIIRENSNARKTRAGADCRYCPCIPGCPQVTRA